MIFTYDINKSMTDEALIKRIAAGLVVLSPNGEDAPQPHGPFSNERRVKVSITVTDEKTAGN